LAVNPTRHTIALIAFLILKFATTPLDLIKHAVLMLFGTVIDLSQRSGTEKLKLNKKVVAAVLKSHRKSWKKRVKLLELFL